MMLLLVSVFVLLITYIKYFAKPQGFPPGPTWFPLVGCFPVFLQLYSKFGYYHLVWNDLVRVYGPIVGLKLGKDRIVVVSGVDAVKHVSTRDDCEGRPDGFFFRMRSFQQRLGVVFTDGPSWQEQRRFSTRHLRNLGLERNSMEHILLEEAEALIASVNHTCNDKSQSAVVSLNNLCNVSVLNVLWAMVAGSRFDLTDARLKQLFKLQHDSFRAIDMSGGIINQLPFVRHLAPELSGYNTLMATINAVYHFLKETLEEHRKTMTSGQPRDLIDAYLDEISLKKNEENSSFHEKQLLTLCFDLFLAGTETTSVTLGFTLLYMLHYPEVLKRAQQQVDQVVGSHRLPALSDRQNLPYVEAVLMEILRHVSIAPIAVPHRTLQDCVIFGYNVPKDTIILMSIWSINQDKEHWIDPEFFRPERFLDESGQVIKDDFFIPFGMGKRRCLGESLARCNLFVFFTSLIQNFDFSSIPGEKLPALTPHDGVTLSPRAFKGVITRRNHS